MNKFCVILYTVCELLLKTVTFSLNKHKFLKGDFNMQFSGKNNNPVDFNI